MVKAIKTATSIALSILIVLAVSLIGTTSFIDANAETAYIDNSSLVTPWVPDSEVELDENGWPTWISDLVIAEARIEKMGPNGTMLKEDVEPMLKHLAELGVNGLWVTPIEDQGLDTVASTYSNMGLHTVDPYLTGQLKKDEPYSNFEPSEENYAYGFQKTKEFVDLCHKYNIRVFFDKVPWGISKVAPLAIANPHWFKGDSVWGGLDWKLDHPEVIKYYYEENIKFVMETGCDGIRWDLEPDYFGYEIYEQMHEELLSKGRKLAFFTEGQSFHGNRSYAFSQYGDVWGNGHSSQYSYDYFFTDVNIVDAVKTGENIGHEMLRSTGESGQDRYYAYQISSHDCIYYHEASMAAWGYQFLYGSFIPLFYVGEEWCASNKNIPGNAAIYPLDIHDFEEKCNNNRKYYEEVKELISYRWKYKDIVNKSVANHRQTNICTAKVMGTTLVQGYARYAGNKGFIVVANVNENTDKAVQMTVAVPFKDMELDSYKTFKLTNIRTGKVMAQGTAKELATFTDTIEHNNVGLYLIEGSGKVETPKDENDNNDALDSNDNLDTNDAPDQEQTEPEKNKVTNKHNKVVYETVFSPWLFVAIIAGALVVIGGVVFLIVKKRK